VVLGHRASIGASVPPHQQRAEKLKARMRRRRLRQRTDRGLPSSPLQTERVKKSAGERKKKARAGARKVHRSSATSRCEVVKPTIHSWDWEHVAGCARISNFFPWGSAEIDRQWLRLRTAQRSIPHVILAGSYLKIAFLGLLSSYPYPASHVCHGCHLYQIS
jgi:hypothetical protein